MHKRPRRPRSVPLQKPIIYPQARTSEATNFIEACTDVSRCPGTFLLWSQIQLLGVQFAGELMPAGFASKHNSQVLSRIDVTAMKGDGTSVSSGPFLVVNDDSTYRQNSTLGQESYNWLLTHDGIASERYKASCKQVCPALSQKCCFTLLLTSPIAMIAKCRTSKIPPSSKWQRKCSCRLESHWCPEIHTQFEDHLQWAVLQMVSFCWKPNYLISVRV